MKEDLVKRFRNETPGVKERIHFNNAGAALPPSIVMNTVIDYLKEEALIGGYEMAAKYRSDINQAYESLARLLNTQAGNVAFANNATNAYNKALSAIPLREGDSIITTFNDYVSNFIAFLQLKKLKGLKIFIAENNQDHVVDPDSVEQLIKKHQPRLIAVTHIPTSSGLVQDIEAIGQLCDQYDIWYLVDACQSVGQRTIDVQRIKCDFLSATSRKFLRGPRGTGFLYVSDKALKAQLEPLFLDLHSAEWSSPDTYQAVDSAKRFEIWERNYGLLLGQKAAIDYALTIGMDSIQARIQKIAQILKSQLAALPKIEVAEFGTQNSGIVTAKIPGWEAEAFKKALWARNINTSLTYQEGARLDLAAKDAKWVSRISVHYYNTEAEIEELMGVLKDIL